MAIESSYGKGHAPGPWSMGFNASAAAEKVACSACVRLLGFAQVRRIALSPSAPAGCPMATHGCRGPRPPPPPPLTLCEALARLTFLAARAHNAGAGALWLAGCRRVCAVLYCAELELGAGLGAWTRVTGRTSRCAMERMSLLRVPCPSIVAARRRRRRPPLARLFSCAGKMVIGSRAHCSTFRWTCQPVNPCSFGNSVRASLLFQKLICSRGHCPGMCSLKGRKKRLTVLQPEDRF